MIFRKIGQILFFCIKDPLKLEAFCIYSTNDEYTCKRRVSNTLYVNRRPLESNNTYALELWSKQFPTTNKDPFDRAINGIIEDLQQRKIFRLMQTILSPNGDYKIKGIDVYNYCTSDLIRAREIDPNELLSLVQRYEILEV